MALQERLFCAIEVPLPELEDDTCSTFKDLLKLTRSPSPPGKASGWVPLLHITLYFFQHDSRKEGDPLWTSEFITSGLRSPQFSVQSFDLTLEKIIFCDTRTLRLKVNDPSGGLQELHYSIVKALELPPFEGGWEGGHVSLYRFNTAEQRCLSKEPSDSSISWVNPLVDKFDNVNYTFKVTKFTLYRSERRGYIPLAEFELK
jgi:hypothetical protein